MRYLFQGLYASLPDVGHVIKELMGDFYYPLYLTDERYRDTFQVHSNRLYFWPCFETSQSKSLAVEEPFTDGPTYTYSYRLQDMSMTKFKSRHLYTISVR